MRQSKLETLARNSTSTLNSSEIEIWLQYVSESYWASQNSQNKFRSNYAAIENHRKILEQITLPKKISLYLYLKSATTNVPKLSEYFWHEFIQLNQ